MPMPIVACLVSFAGATVAITLPSSPGVSTPLSVQYQCNAERLQDCYSRAYEWCQNAEIDTPIVQKATAVARCMDAYRDVCRSNHCD